MPIGFPADADTLRKHSTWFIVYGALMVLLGLFAIAAPGVATLTVTLMVGWLLLLGGGFGLFAVISGGTSAPGFWWNLLTAIVYILAGLAVLTRPIAGVLTLTIILAAYLLAGGVMRIFLAVGYREKIPGAWVWVLLSGIDRHRALAHHHDGIAGHGDLGAGTAGRHQPSDDGFLHRHGGDVDAAGGCLLRPAAGGKNVVMKRACPDPESDRPSDSASPVWMSRACRTACASPA